jgi:2-polyprenyl-6-methoxyphenol hydroxylase-like FAD-dependent oxidoreductase
MEADVTDLVRDEGRVVGVTAKTPRGTMEVRAGLTVGADGRSSIVRERAGLEVLDQGAPMDVLWMRISRKESDPEQTFGHVEPGRMLVMLNRNDYWQCAYVIAKGEGERIRQKGIPWLRDEMTMLSPFLRDRVGELETWDDVHVLTVAVDRLKKWFSPGLLCIGDAAHAMSPVGGVGINLAIQDAVATANLLAEPLSRGVPTESELSRVQARREFPTRATQRLQIAVQNKVIKKVLHTKKTLRAPWPLKLLGRSTLLRSVPAWVVGMGFRSEHVRTTPAK